MAELKQTGRPIPQREELKARMFHIYHERMDVAFVIVSR